MAEVKATSKLRLPHSSAEKPLQGCVGVFISKLPACQHYIIKCSIFLEFYAVLESAQKCALLRAKGLWENRENQSQQTAVEMGTVIMGGAVPGSSYKLLHVYFICILSLHQLDQLKYMAPC